MPPIFDSLITPALKSVTDLINQFHLSPEDKAKAAQAISDAHEKAAQDARQYEVDLEKLQNEDRASARTRQSLVKDITPTVLAFAVTAGFFGLLFYMVGHPPPAGSKDMLNIMLGALGSAWIAIVSYYFGSSSGSDRKTELLSSGEK